MKNTIFLYFLCIIACLYLILIGTYIEKERKQPQTTIITKDSFPEIPIVPLNK